MIFWSALQASAYVSHACGSTPFTPAVSISVKETAADFSTSPSQWHPRITLMSIYQFQFSDFLAAGFGTLQFRRPPASNDLSCRTELPQTRPARSSDRFPDPAADTPARLPFRASLPGRPAESRRQPPTDPDLTLSRHPARAIARRLPPSAEQSGSSQHSRLAHAQQR